MSDPREKYMTKVQLDRMSDLSEEHYDFIKQETGLHKIAGEQSEGFDRGYEAACFEESKTPMTHFWIDESFKRQSEIINLRTKLDTAMLALKHIRTCGVCISREIDNGAHDALMEIENQNE